MPARTLVDLLHFRLRHAQTDGLLFQQFAVVDLHRQPLGQARAESPAHRPQVRAIESRPAEAVELPAVATEAPRTIAATTATTSSSGTRAVLTDQIILCRLGRLVAEEVTGETSSDAVHLQCSGPGTRRATSLPTATSAGPPWLRCHQPQMERAGPSRPTGASHHGPPAPRCPFPPR